MGAPIRVGRRSLLEGVDTNSYFVLPNMYLAFLQLQSHSRAKKVVSRVDLLYN